MQILASLRSDFIHIASERSIHIVGIRKLWREFKNHVPDSSEIRTMAVCDSPVFSAVSRVICNFLAAAPLLNPAAHASTMRARIAIACVDFGRRARWK